MRSDCLLHPESQKALQEIQRLIQLNSLDRKSVAFVSGNFNILHPGHLRLLKFAADCGPFLIVAILPQSPVNEIVSEALRLEAVQAMSWVRFAFILRDPVESFLKVLQPAFVVKGKEHETEENPEQKILENYGGKLLFSSGEVQFSSVDWVQKIFQRKGSSSFLKPLDFQERHQFTLADLRKILKKFRGLRVTVVGDLIVDEYIHCDPLGMSQEDPTLVISPVLTESFVGGAGIVAAHARSLGAQVKFFSITGKDATAVFAQQKLAEYGVESFFFEDESRPTPLKQRFRAHLKTLLRVSHLKQHELSADLAKKMLSALKQAFMSGTDLLIFADFNYGCLPQRVVNLLIRWAQEKNIYQVADSQSSSQVGDISRFKGMSLVTPTEREVRLALRDFKSGLVVLADHLKKRAQAKNVLMTLGAEGLLIQAEASRKKKIFTDRLPAFNTAPRDVAGAGDSLLTCSALALAVGGDIWQGAYLGSLAAACQVSKTGNIPLTVQELESELQSSRKMDV